VKERAVADMVLVTGLILLLTNLVTPAQYLAARLGRPLIDPWLAAGDALLGIHVPALTAWTRSSPYLPFILGWAYVSLIPQFVATVLLLGIVYARVDRLWEYCLHFHVCLLITLAGLALFPAACVFQYYGFESTLPQARFIAHFNGLRSGTFTVLDFRDAEGLISMPSFHAAGGLFVTWAFRGMTAFVPFALLNLVMLAATVLTGAHYFVDLVATVAMVAFSVWIHRLLTASDRPPAHGPDTAG
jgi:hypothetical protein